MGRQPSLQAGSVVEVASGQELLIEANSQMTEILDSIHINVHEPSDRKEAHARKMKVISSCIIFIGNCSGGEKRHCSRFEKETGLEGRKRNRLSHHLLLQDIPDKVLGELGLPLNSLHSLLYAVALSHQAGNPPDYLVANGVILIDVFPVPPHVPF